MEATRARQESAETVSAARIASERLDAATQEHRRYSTVVGLEALGLQQCSSDIRQVAKRVHEIRDERDLERVAAALDKAAAALAKVFTVSPVAAAVTSEPRPF